ncbi:MAG: hypothetical protein K2M57_02550, partial [Paramuribaculum sp.]|nr:hypothetical protein [Paramuribaculum sp.]
IDGADHSGGLSEDVAGVEDGAAAVDACRARDEQVTAVGVVDGCATLKGHAIVGGAVHAGGRVEVGDLPGGETADSVGVEL